MTKRKALLAVIAIAVPTLGCSAAAPDETQTKSVAADPLKAAVANPARSAANRARDVYRHPEQTLRFFGVKQSDLVVEISPGGGWYTEILAPFVADKGSLALVAAEQQLRGARARATANSELYRSVLFSPIEGWGDKTSFPPASADVVLTFRNVHNWYMQGEAENAFAAFFAMLRPGGTLGVVEHRLPESRPDSDMLKSGYMKQSVVIAMAEAAGFKLADSSEINANPKDIADYPEGVWTLPPSLALKDKDREKYLAIGESDRMTLKFVKPE